MQIMTHFGKQNAFLYMKIDKGQNLSFSYSPGTLYYLEHVI